MSPIEGLATSHRLRVFLEVADQQSFQRAADRLFLSQPGVSAHIKELERAVGEPLFLRKRPALVLTDAGKSLQVYARKYFSLLEEMESSLLTSKGDLRGHVSLGASFQWEPFLPAGLTSFSRINPRVTFFVRFGMSVEMTELVLDDRLALAFVSVPPTDSRLETIHFGEHRDRSMVIMSPDHPLAREKVVEPARLRDFPLISLPSQFITAPMMELVKAKYTIEITNFSGLKSLVACGAGVSVILESMLDGTGRELAKVPLAMEPSPTQMLGIRKKQGYLSAAARALLDHMGSQATSAYGWRKRQVKANNITGGPGAND